MAPFPKTLPKKPNPPRLPGLKHDGAEKLKDLGGIDEPDRQLSASSTAVRTRRGQSGDGATTRPLIPPKGGWVIVKGPTTAERHFADGLRAIWERLHAQTRTPGLPHHLARGAKVDGGRTNISSGIYREALASDGYRDTPRFDVHLEGAKGDLLIVGELPENGQPSLTVKALTTTGGRQEELSYVRLSEEHWFINAKRGASPAEVREHLQRTGGFELHPDSRQGRQILDDVSKLVAAPLFQSLIGAPKVKTSPVETLSRGITQQIGEVRGGTVVPVEIGKVIVDSAPTPGWRKVARAPVAPKAEAAATSGVNLGPTEFRAQPDGSFLVKTQADYGDVLKAIGKGGVLQGILITPNKDGTSTLKLNQPFPADGGVDSEYIGTYLGSLFG